eukprot:366082-Chlamydomonas_euryale.AAC.16
MLHAPVWKNDAGVERLCAADFYDNRHVLQTPADKKKGDSDTTPPNVLMHPRCLLRLHANQHNKKDACLIPSSGAHINLHMRNDGATWLLAHPPSAAERAVFACMLFSVSLSLSSHAAPCGGAPHSGAVFTLSYPTPPCGAGCIDRMAASCVFICSRPAAYQFVLRSAACPFYAHRTGAMQASGLMNRVRAAAPAAPRAPVRAAAPLAARNMRLRIAAVDNQETSQLEEGGAAAGAPERKVVAEVDPALAQELEVEELDAAQEQLLSWMMKDDDEQNADLDEMVDYDEFGDEEYADLYEEVEELFEAADVELKVSDKVMGTVYEVDEDGAYVEIGQKYSGFVPLSECSFARLKTVSSNCYMEEGPKRVRKPCDETLSRLGACPGQACCGRTSPTRLSIPSPANLTCERPCHALQPLEVLRVGMSREFLVIEDEDDYGQVILSLAANEVRAFVRARACMRGSARSVAHELTAVASCRKLCGVRSGNRSPLRVWALLGANSSDAQRGPPHAHAAERGAGRLNRSAQTPMADNIGVCAVTCVPL